MPSLVPRNYMTGVGPSVTCEHCGSIFHAEATECPDSACKEDRAQQDRLTYAQQFVDALIAHEERAIAALRLSDQLSEHP